ncbi:MAG TPA: SDR family NAD(P)-dependent oxidoreductase [Mesorhizobium sp.]|jgi:NAD(P)-dependent dehydrogenase (short-subunit alcohol dehydrogenase family)
MNVGNHALVTGGGTGVGKAIAASLLKSGVAVTISGRRGEVLEAAASDLAASAEGRAAVSTAIADVTDEAAMAALHATAEAAGTPFDIVVANAGIASSAPTYKTSLADWQSTIDTNLTGAFLTVKPALAGMSARGSGRIVFIASIAGLKGAAYVAPYVAAKHGVIGLMRALAIELAKTGVTVNAVCPGFVETPMLDDTIQRIVQKTGRSEAEARASLTASNPQGRFIQPDEVAAAVSWLVSDAAKSVTGQSIALSGGETW